MRTTIDWHEERGFYACPEYQGAIAFWFRRHICRLQPWPEGLERSFAGMGAPVYEAMVGPSEFRVTGKLADWDPSSSSSRTARTCRSRRSPSASSRRCATSSRARRPRRDRTAR